MKTKADKIKTEIAQLNMKLEQLAPHEAMGARELARASGVSPSTAARFKAGETADMRAGTLAKLIPYTRTCPLCGSAVEPGPAEEGE